MQGVRVTEKAGHLTGVLEYPGLQRPGPLQQLVTELAPPAPQGPLIRSARRRRQLSAVTQVAQRPFDLRGHVMLEGEQKVRQEGEGLPAVGTAEAAHLEPSLDAVGDGVT